MQRRAVCGTHNRQTANIIDYFLCLLTHSLTSTAGKVSSSVHLSVSIYCPGLISTKSKIHTTRIISFTALHCIALHYWSYAQLSAISARLKSFACLPACHPGTGTRIHKMAEVRLPPLPDEYDAMFQDSMKEMKETVMKIRGTFKEGQFWKELINRV